MSASTPFQDEAHQHLIAGNVPAYMQALGQAARRAASELRREPKYWMPTPRIYSVAARTVWKARCWIA